MSNLETALRRALEKGDINDPEFRTKVYEAASGAIEKPQDDGTSLPEDVLVSRRKALAAAISVIENEIQPQVSEAPAVEPVAPAVESPTPPEPVITAQRQEPRLDEPAATPTSGTDMPHLRAEPVVEAPVRETKPKKSKKAKPERKKRHPFAAILSVLVGAALVIIGFMFVWTTGAFQSAEQRDTSIPNPPLRLEAEDSDGGVQRAPALASEGTAEERAVAEGWVTVFSPSDPTTLTLTAGAEASIESEPFGDYARLTTPGDSEVLIDVPVGTLDEMQGGTVQVNIVARAEDGQSTEMAVTCDFGALGNCDRKRFIVGQAPAEYLFRLELPEVGQVQSGGLIRLRADINGDQRVLDLLAVRMRAVGDR